MIQKSLLFSPMQLFCQPPDIEESEIEIFTCPYGNGKKFVLPKNDQIIAHSIKTMRWWEYHFLTNLYRLTIEQYGPGVYFDVGANIGTSSVLASEVFEHIYAFEIDVKNCQLFCYAMGLNRTSYSLYNLAVSSEVGEANVFLNNFNHGGHSIVSKDGSSSNLKVEKFCLDDFNPDVANVRFLYIDTEGHDFKVLAGSHKFIARQDSRPIVELEFQPSSLVKHGSSINELLSFMDAFNYEAYINAANVLAPVTRDALTDMFFLWQQTLGWIDIYLIP